MKAIYTLLFIICFNSSINAETIQKEPALMIYSLPTELPAEVQPCSKFLSNKSACKVHCIFIDIPHKYEYKNFNILIHTNLTSDYSNDDISIHLTKQDGSYKKISLFSSKVKRKENASIQRSRSFELEEFFPNFPKDGTYNLYFTYKDKKSNIIEIDMNVSEFYKKGEINNSDIKDVMREGKLIVYQNGCDYEKAAPHRKNECMEYPRKKNGKKDLSALGIFFNLPQKYDEFEFPLCARIHVDYGYEDSNIVIHLEGPGYKQSKVFATKGKLEGDYKRFVRADKKGEERFFHLSSKMRCTDINELLPTPDSGIYNFYFTFRDRKSNVVQLELEK